MHKSTFMAESKGECHAKFLHPKFNDTYPVLDRVKRILGRLSSGSWYEPNRLAHEIGISLHTLQWDMIEFLDVLPVETSEKGYRLEASYGSRFSEADIDWFAKAACIHAEYSSFFESCVRDMYECRLQDTLLERSRFWEGTVGKANYLRSFERATRERRLVDLQYRDSPVVKFYRDLEPYGSAIHKKDYYLMAKAGNEIRAFCLAKVWDINVRLKHFEFDAAVKASVESKQGVWFSNDTFTVVLRVSADAADYFKHQKLFIDQFAEEDQLDGSLLVTSKKALDLGQVLPIVRYWLPHIQIISPSGMHQELMQGLANYLEICPVPQDNKSK